MDLDRLRSDIDLRNFLVTDDLRRSQFHLNPERLHPAWLFSCTIRMLVVLDGGGFGNADFGLDEFLNAFHTRPGPGVRFHVTKAHQGNDADADINGFVFSAHDLSRYDVIWLFGVVGFGSLPAADLRALAQFMDGGGGVFATGDHESLGVKMCGAVPRVRSMRKWHWPNPGPNGEPLAPSGTGTGRYDTVVDVRLGGPAIFDDQSDATPQRIRVKMYATPHPFLWGHTFRYPHPVLCGPGGVIDILPDHAHEGECYVPADLTAVLTQNGYACTEYPPDSTGQRISPEVIAWSHNQSGISEKGPVNPGTFGAIGVLDGHRANVGRVLVDATWHHFFNINLRGENGNPNAELSAGFYHTQPGRDALARIKAYYRNIGVWLARGSTHRCIANRGWWWVRWQHRIAMDLAQINRPFSKVDAYEIIRIGRIARDVMGKFAPQCQTLERILIYIPVEIRVKLLWPIVPPGPMLPDFPLEGVEKLRSDPASAAIAQALLDGAVGAIIYRLATEFPDPEMGEKLEGMGDNLTEMLQEAAKHGLSAGAAMAREGLDNARDLREGLDRML